LGEWDILFAVVAESIGKSIGLTAHTLDQLKIRNKGLCGSGHGGWLSIL